MRHCAVGKGENHIRTSAWIIFCNIKTSVSLQASDMFWNFKVYIYWVFCWIKIIHQTRNIYPVELINGIVNILVKFIIYWFLSFFFMIYHYYLVYWCLPIPLHYWLFLPSLTKVQDKIWLTEVHHWFSNAMEA